MRNAIPKFKNLFYIRTIIDMSSIKSLFIRKLLSAKITTLIKIAYLRRTE